MTGLPAHTTNLEKEKALTRASGGWQPDLYPLGSVICMERGTSLPYLNDAVRFMEGNRSGSSRPPSLMIGGGDATGYLRNKVTHCCSSSLLKLCLNMHFTQEVQSTKAKSSMALDDSTTTFLLGLALPHFCLPPDRGPAWGGWRQPEQMRVKTCPRFLGLSPLSHLQRLCPKCLRQGCAVLSSLCAISNPAASLR